MHINLDVYSNRKRHPYTRNSLIDSGWLAHGGLDVESLDVLPVLLEKRDQEVDRHSKVVDELIVVHVDVTDGNVEAEDLLHLELDGGLDFVNLGLHGLGMSQHGGELTSLVETGTEKSGNLLDDGLGSEEGIVALGKLLDELLVLVELLELIGRFGLNADLVGLIDMLSITDDADLLLWSGDVGELDGTAETLVFCGIVVLEGDLELNSLEEVSLLRDRSLQKDVDGFVKGLSADLGHFVSGFLSVRQSKSDSKMG